ncbi:MAG: Asp-tRNA(Asn)/Glu-tRNA(Gln) amidotransferase subunit GatA [Bacteroidia bacterium]|nr:Asp-tRNA(Asn)/Glu-tRNA(Gln) amidotransferase subunit GatA [Bacteroidia bacterium]MDW8333701.1 Asp-tRNA(Asn)/Glu-tRNA(Gln) amidotransferase subunit GatA [Bacteroidia bacterium]
MEDYTDFRRRLPAGETDCVRTVETFLERIEQTRHLNIFIETYADEALRRAEEIDRMVREGKAGRAAGMVVSIKDVISYAGHELTAGSKILRGFKTVLTATALERLLDEGAIVIGRTNCDEFAMGSSNEHSCYGPCRNPYDAERTPGGSSGGSAAAVAAGLCHVSLGSDTGGSVRQPASFCNVVGVKPTYGRVSRWGLVAYASSFDQIGPIASSVSDVELALEIISGFDPKDNTSSNRPWAGAPTPKRYRIGVIRETLESQGLSPEIKQGVERQIQELQAAGHSVEYVAFPYLDYLVPTYYILTTAEASSNLARYDGIRYGYRSPRAQNLDETYVFSRTEGFGDEVKRRIILGTFVLSAGYYDDYYQKAQKVRRLLRDHTRELFKRCDVLVSPTTPTTAFKLGDKTDNPVAMYWSDIYTVHANLTGMPAISVPCGFDSSGLPFGIHFLAPEFAENRLFDLGRIVTGR